MTSHAGRLYVVACVIVTFFLVWALVAAHPWGRTTTDKRTAALAAREARLRHEAVLVGRVVALRWQLYRSELAQRRLQIAARRAQIAQQRRSQQVAAAAAAAAAAAPAATSLASAPSPAPQVRVVNLPPLTITRSS